MLMIDSVPFTISKRFSLLELHKLILNSTRKHKDQEQITGDHTQRGRIEKQIVVQSKGHHTAKEEECPTAAHT